MAKISRLSGPTDITQPKRKKGGEEKSVGKDSSQSSKRPETNSEQDKLSHQSPVQMMENLSGKDLTENSSVSSTDGSGRETKVRKSVKKAVKKNASSRNS